MSNSTLRPNRYHSNAAYRWTRRLQPILAAFSLGLVMSWASHAAAQAPAQTPAQTPTQTPTQTPAQTPSSPPANQNPAPPELTNTLSQIDAAASKADLAAVMRFYSPSFTSSDGLTYDTLRKTLEALWKRYPNLTYKTELTSWEPQGNGYSTVTTTTIAGKYPDSRRNLTLSATITSRQRFEGNQIVEQQVLNERSQITSGQKPPTVNVNLPEQVAPGQEFDFDAVVAEPLGERLLLGAALDEPINPDNYLNPAPIELDLLTSGGLFKVGRAPTTPGDRWVSAVVVRDDGITAVTQRLRVEGKK